MSTEEPEEAQVDEQERFERCARRKLIIADHTLDDIDLESKCPLDSGRHVPQPQHSAGRLGVLPRELISEVLLTLDVASLMVFRRVSHRAMSLVDSLGQYAAVSRHCPDVLRAVIALRATYFSFGALYRALSTAQCETCHRFGGYLYLITCRRTCFSCFTLDRRYLPVLSKYMHRYTNLSEPELRRLPHVVTLPGTYTPRAIVMKQRLTVFDREAALGHLAPPGDTLSIWDICDARGSQPRRYMAIISAPHMRNFQSADWGFFCVGCRTHKNTAANSRNKYSDYSIMDHIRHHKSSG